MDTAFVQTLLHRRVEVRKWFRHQGTTWTIEVVLARRQMREVYQNRSFMGLRSWVELIKYE